MGRSPADTVIDDTRVSRRHARLHWVGAAWCVRDLGSVNGTWLDGRRLASGIDVPLRQGAVLVFSDPVHSYIVESDEAPEAFAVRADTGETIQGEGGSLLLGEGDTWTELTRRPEGDWLLEDHLGERRIAVDGEDVRVDGHLWTLHLPGPVVVTEVAHNAAVLLADVVLRFEVSKDWEEIGLAVQHGPIIRDLGIHAHHYPLFLLARARLAEGEGEDAGWLDVADFTAKAKMTTGHFNLSVHKTRAALRLAGVLDPAGIIERRARTGRVRFGAVRVELVDDSGVDAPPP